MAESKGKVEVSPDLLKQVLNPWLLGADPEFVVLTPPTRIFNTGQHAVTAARPYGEIGHDHGGRVWELRPAAAQSSYGLIINLWKLLKDAAMAPVERFKWRAGGVSEGDTIGGHVHFGFRNWADGTLAALARVTTSLETLEILPHAESTLRRNTNPDYGDLLGTRTCGGHQEYRAPASWLDRPGQALAVLTTMKLAAFEPQSTQWRHNNLKTDYLDWVAAMSQRDVDGFFLWRLIEKQGFSAIQADPDTNFRPNWRKEDLWAR